MLETREAKSAVLGKGERVCTLCMGKERGERQVDWRRSKRIIRYIFSTLGNPKPSVLSGRG